MALKPDNSLGILWERFLTAINHVGPRFKIVIRNHSHLAITSYIDGRFNAKELCPGTAADN